MSKNIVKKGIEAEIVARKEKFIAIAGTQFDINRFLQSAIYTIHSNPKLMECTRASILKSLYHSAALGIIPDGFGGLGYIIPYHNFKKGVYEAQFQAGWKGLVLLAKASDPNLKVIIADVIREGDKWEYYRTATEDVFSHRPVSTGGEVIASYAIARYKDNSSVMVLLYREEIEKVRAVSKMKDGVWNEWYSEMAKKTAIKRLIKQIGESSIVAKALDYDNNLEIGEVDKSIVEYEVNNALQEDKEVQEPETKEEAQNNERRPIKIETMEELKTLFKKHAELKGLSSSKEKKEVIKLVLNKEYETFADISEDEAQKIIAFLKAQ